MRVLLLFANGLEKNVSMGGVAEFLFALPPELKKMGVETIIYTRDKSLTKLEGPFHLTDSVTTYKGPYLKPGFLVSKKKLAPVLQLCQQEKIDVVHAQGTYLAGFMALQIFKRTGIPYVVTSHSDIVATNTKRMNRRNVQTRCREILKSASQVTHLTPIMENFSHQIFDTKEKSTTIGGGIHYSAHSLNDTIPEKNFLLAIGRLERSKGFHILIAMYAELLKQGVTTSLVLAGLGSALEEMKQQAKTLGLNVVTQLNQVDSIPERSVVFAGYVSDELKNQLISQCQCMLFATQPELWEEAFGLVQIEAMAAGKALIASDISVTRYLTTLGLQAKLVTPNDIGAWATATNELLKNPHQRHLMGKTNHANAKQFDWSVLASAYKKVYERCH